MGKKDNKINYQDKSDALKRVHQLDEYSHDMRAPISSIKILSELLLENESIKGKQREQLEMIHAANETLHEFIEHMLLSKNSSENHELNEKICLKGVLIDQFKQYKPEAENKNVELRLQLPDDSCFIRGDKFSVERVFSNLISNALKFTSEKGSVSLAVEVTKYHIVTKVEDDGIGMNEETFSAITSEDTQELAKLSQNKETGHGLGIKICKEILNDHQALMKVNSKEGKGASFSLIWNRV